MAATTFYVERRLPGGRVTFRLGLAPGAYSRNLSQILQLPRHRLVYESSTTRLADGRLIVTGVFLRHDPRPAA